MIADSVALYLGFVLSIANRPVVLHPSATFSLAPQQKYQWDNEDFAGEMDPEVRNQLLREDMNSLTGVQDVIDTVSSLDVNASLAENGFATAVGAIKAWVPKPIDEVIDKTADVIKKAFSPTVGELRKSKLKDVHHIIQDAVVRDLPGYN